MIWYVHTATTPYIRHHFIRNVTYNLLMSKGRKDPATLYVHTRRDPKNKACKCLKPFKSFPYCYQPYICIKHVTYLAFHLSVYTANRVFIVMVALCVKRYSKKKIGFWDLNALRSRFKVPASATPSEIDRESVLKRVWVSEWVVTSSQESQNPSSSGNCCFSSGEEFPSTKNKQIKVGKAMRT